MSRVCWAVAFVLALAWAQPSTAGELRHESYYSPLLGRNAQFVVYVPDGYDGGRLAYPVLYLLHGAGGDENAWADRGHIKEKADRLIASGEIPPTLIVMPGCRGCWWIDGPKEKAETWFWAELIPSVASRYRTIEAREGRLVAGLSAGGYGSVRYALKYPDRIAAAAAFSPAVYSTAPPAASAARSQPAFLGPDGQFSQAAWNANNYPTLTGHYFGQPARVPLYLVSGDNDGFGITFETALLFKALYDRQPAITELRIVDGDHNWAVWSAAVDGALKYMYRFAAHPVPATTAAHTSALVIARPR